MRLERARAHRLARLGAAQVQGVLPDRMGPKEVVERDHAMNLGARQVQHVGDDADRGLRHVADLVLNRMQNRQQRAGLRGSGLGEAANIGIPLLFGAHWLYKVGFRVSDGIAHYTDRGRERRGRAEPTMCAASASAARRTNLTKPAATLITPHAAQQAIEARVSRLPIESRGLELCLGQTLGEDVYAERDNPPFDRVCMDGIAIDSAAFAAGTRRYRIQGTQPAGAPAVTLADPGSAIEVTTGAVLPRGADAVIPLEEYAVAGDAASVRDGASGNAFRNVARRGSDSRRDVPMLEAGIRLGAREIAVAAAAGLNRLNIARPPRIAVVSTGNELVAPGRPIADHQVRDSNAYALRAALAEHGVADVEVEHVADDEGLIVRSLRRQLVGHDMIVLTGGVSHGKLDLVRAALAAVGVQEVLHQVAQRPGKPMWFGVGPERQAVFGLPGNPVAALTCLRRYVVPAIERALGASALPRERIALDSPAPGARRLAHFVPVRLRHDDLGRVAAVPRTPHGSGDFLALAGTDGFVELPPSAAELPAGFVADLYRW